MPTSGRPRPSHNFRHCLRIFPETDDYLASHEKASADVAELTIPMSSLVQVHEIHVDRRPWQFAIELRMKVEKWFGQRLQTCDPHLPRRESVHPENQSDAIVASAGIATEARISSGVVMTGLNTTRKGITFSASSQAATFCALPATCARDSSP
jgi:hypothetical protein